MKPKFRIEFRPSTFLKFVVLPASICILAGVLFVDLIRKKDSQ